MCERERERDMMEARKERKIGAKSREAHAAVRKKGRWTTDDTNHKFNVRPS